MTRRFVAVTLGLTATVAFLVGLVVAGTMTPAPAMSASEPRAAIAPAASRLPAAPGVAAVSFADVAERLNPAVVNINATARAGTRARRRATPPDQNRPARGAGTGFIIDTDGFILTNHHVIDGADRIMVGLTDGRNLRAERIGSDPDTDIALIKVESLRPLPVAPLGDSDTLRVGDWVLAIGNPLAYEHTVTVGVVSFIGRKLFDTSLDRYIQTDAAINFGNSGGPLINTRGEVIGINAAVSLRAANIGFAVPINQATAILSQLRDSGRVSRGYVGVLLRDVDPDLQQSLGLRSSDGALVQDVTPGSPGARAGIRPYDLIVAVDGKPIEENDALVALIAARRPGTTVTLQILRDSRALNVTVKLAERPPRERPPVESSRRLPPPVPSRRLALGIAVREIAREEAARVGLPDGTGGVIVSRVESLSPAFEADVERGDILLEINRQPVRSIDDFRRLTSDARAGDVLALYLYRPGLERRTLQTVRVDP